MKASRWWLLCWLSLLAGCASQDTVDPREAARINTELGAEYYSQGQTDRAREKYERALELYADYAPAHAALGLLFAGIDRNDEASEHYREALSLDSKDSATRNNYAVFLCRTGDAAEAMEEFARVLEDLDYRSPKVAMTNAGVCARKLSDMKLAETYFLKALKKDKKYPEALDQMAQLCYDRGQYLRSRAFLQRLEASTSLDRDRLVLAVRIEEAMGDVAAASRYRTQLRQRYPHARTD